MSPRFVLGQENVPYVAEVVDRSLKADCTDFTDGFPVIAGTTRNQFASTRKLGRTIDDYARDGGPEEV